MQGDNDLEAPLLIPSKQQSPVSTKKAAECCLNPIHQLLHAESPHKVVVGMMLFALSTVFVTLMGTFAKLLVNEGMPVFETVLARSSLMVVFSIPFLIKSGADPRGNRRLLLLLRGCLGFGSVSSIFWAVKFLPLSDATVLSFLAPLFVAITAPLLLKESPSRAVFQAVPFCLSGVVLVARPSFIFHSQSLSTIGVIIGIMQAFFSASAKMSVRELRRSEKDPVIVIWMAVISTIGSALMCICLPHHFRAPRGAHEWLLLLATGLAGFGNQITMTAGLRRCPATQATAMSYLAVIWGLLLGWVEFHEHFSALSLLGAALICGSTLFLSLAQSRSSSSKGSSIGGSSSSAGSAGGGGGDAVLQRIVEKQPLLEVQIELGAEDSWSGREGSGEMLGVPQMRLLRGERSVSIEKDWSGADKI